MKRLNRYIYLLLFCIFLQNDAIGTVSFLKSLIDSNDHFSLFLTDSDNSSSEEESEEGEKESKENENKENENNENENKENENKEKEKEFKNIKYLHSFVFLLISENTGPYCTSEDSKLFSSDTDTETPPPKFILVA